jgi:hypothetical protein
VAVTAVDGGRRRGQLGIDGEVAWTREGKGEEGKRLARILMPLVLLWQLMKGRSGGATGGPSSAMAGVGGAGWRAAVAAAWGEALGHGGLK